jgi:hypothetical protein
MRTTTRTLIGALAISAGLAGTVAGCGDDDGTSGPAAAAEADLAAACDASIEVDAALQRLPEPAGEEATDEEKAAVRQAFAPVEAALQDVEAALPDLTAEVEAGVEMLRSLGDSGDPADHSEEIAYETERYFYEQCEDDQRLDVNAIDYAFEGAETVTSDPYRIHVTNSGSDVHELAGATTARPARWRSSSSSPRRSRRRRSAS